LSCGGWRSSDARDIEAVEELHQVLRRCIRELRLEMQIGTTDIDLIRARIRIDRERGEGVRTG
jgi:hypothetical protein